MSGALNHAARLHTTAFITLVRFLFLPPTRDMRSDLSIAAVHDLSDSER